MPSVRPKPGETVAVHFTSIEPDRTITKNSLPIFGYIGKNKKPGNLQETHFNDGEIIFINYATKGLDWYNENDLKKMAALGLFEMRRSKILGEINKTKKRSRITKTKSLPKAEGTGKKKVKKKSIRRKKKQTGGRKNKKKSCGSSFSLPNIFGFLNKTKKSKQKVGGS